MGESEGLAVGARLLLSGNDPVVQVWVPIGFLDRSGAVVHIFCWALGAGRWAPGFRERPGCADFVSYRAKNFKWKNQFLKKLSIGLLG